MEVFAFDPKDGLFNVLVSKSLDIGLLSDGQ